MPRKFKHWITLNKKGLELYGHIFQRRDIPVVSMVPTIAKIEGRPQRTYLIYHEELTPEEIEAMLKDLSKRFHASKAEIKPELEANRVPIREMYVSSAGTNHPGFFLE